MGCGASRDTTVAGKESKESGGREARIMDGAAASAREEESSDEVRGAEEGAGGRRPSLLTVRDSGTGDARSDARSVSELHTKFLQDPSFVGGKGVFGSIGMFDSGLESRVGRMDVLPVRALFGEHCLSLDSAQEFQAPNASGRTTPRGEWEFVVGKDAVDEKWEFRRVIRGGGEGCSMQRGRNAKTIDALMETEEAKESGLRVVELVALRLYTGPMYYKYNSVLRGQAAGQSGGANLYSTSINLIVSGLLKLSRISRPPSDRAVYRGLSGVALPPSFFELDRQGFAGGTELGFMSTTTEMAVACQYARGGNGELATLFRLELGKTSVGANVTWLSQFEHECEMLYPPLTHLEIVGNPTVEGGVSIVTLRPTVNQHFMVLEDVIGYRRSGLQDVANSLAWDMRHWAVREGVLQGRQEQIEALLKNMENEVASNKAEWYNANSHYRQAFNLVLDIWESGCAQLAESLWAKAKGDVEEGGDVGDLQQEGMSKAIRARADLCVPTEANSKRLVGMRREMIEVLERKGGGKEADAIKAKRELGIDLKEAAEVQEAVRLLTECLEFSRRQGDLTLEAEVLNDIALCHQDSGEYQVSVRELEASIGILRGFQDPPLGTIAQRETNVANMSKNEEALQRHQAALEMKKRVSASEVDIAASEMGVALALQALDRPQEALAYFERAYDVQKEIHGMEHIDVAYTLHNIALCLRKTGKNEEALAAYERVIKIKKKRLGASHPDVAVTQMNVGVIHYSLGRFSEALELYHLAAESFQGAQGKGIELAKILDNMALCYRSQGQLEESVSKSLAAKKLYVEAVGTNHPSVAVCLGILAATYEAMGRVDDAVREYKDLVQLWKELAGEEEGPNAAAVRLCIVRALWGVQRYGEIPEHVAECVRAREKAFGSVHVATAEALVWSAHTNFVGLQEFQQAAAQYRRCLEVFEANADAAQAASTRFSLANCLRDGGHRKEALEQFVQCKGEYEALYGAQSPQCMDAAARADALSAEEQAEAAKE